MFAGSVTIIEDDPIVGWDLSMMEDEGEKKLSFSTKKQVDLDAVAATETTAVRVLEEGVEAVELERAVATQPDEDGTDETKQAMVERIQAAEIGEETPAHTAESDEAGDGKGALNSRNLRMLLLVVMAVVLLVAMVKIGTTSDSDVGVDVYELECTEETFGHSQDVTLDDEIHGL